METYKPSLAAILEELKLYEALAVDTATQISGVLYDNDWKNAERVTGFKEIITGSGLAKEQTSFSILYDQYNLYLRIECQEPKINEMERRHVAHDSAVFEDDCIEVFIDTCYDRLTYYHFAANSNGTRYEGKRWDNSWDAPWEVIARIESSSWFLDITIPFSSLGYAPEQGDLWGFNISRIRRAGGDYTLSGWSEGDRYRAFHKPGKFGLLLFGGSRGYVKEKFLPIWQERVEETSAKLADDFLAFQAPPKDDYVAGHTEHLRELYDELEKQPRAARVYSYHVPRGYRAATTEKQAGWIDAKTIQLKGLKVTLSQPVLVARSREFLWFPSLIRKKNGDLMATMSNVPDGYKGVGIGSFAWSLDGGFTWLEPKRILNPGWLLKSETGDLLSWPCHISGGEYNIGAAVCHRIVEGELDVQSLEEETTVTGWPRPVGNGSGYVFGFDRQTVRLKGSGFLATLYGFFKDTQKTSVVAAESYDGVNWIIRSVIADENCELNGEEGPGEASICRLKDGRIMCIWRNCAGVPYGQSWSQDEGITWTKPVAMVDDAGEDMGSVLPGLEVMKYGTVALFGGRPGIFLWINADGTGNNWQSINVHMHHNAFCPEEPIEAFVDGSMYLGSTCNNDMVALDETHLLLMYDRIPHGWNAIPKGSPDSNSIWAVRVEITYDE